MKHKIRNILLALSLLIVAAPMTSCNKKTGCKINEKATTKTNKRGKVKGKTKSNLLPKKMRKKKKRKKRS